MCALHINRQLWRYFIILIYINLFSCVCVCERWKWELYIVFIYVLLNLYNVWMRCTWYIYYVLLVVLWLQKPCLMLSLYHIHFCKMCGLAFVRFFFFSLVSKWIYAFMEYNQKRRVTKAKLLFYFLCSMRVKMCWALSIAGSQQKLSK